MNPNHIHQAVITWCIYWFDSHKYPVKSVASLYTAFLICEIQLRARIILLSTGFLNSIVPLPVSHYRKDSSWAAGDHSSVALSRPTTSIYCDIIPEYGTQDQIYFVFLTYSSRRNCNRASKCLVKLLIDRILSRWIPKFRIWSIILP